MGIIKRTLLALACAGASLYASAQLPSVQLKTLDGRAVSADTIGNDGRPFVVSFFATWCKPCNRELRAIHEDYLDWQEETGMKLVAVSIDEGQNAGKVKPLVDSEGWEYEVLLDTNSELKRTLGIESIPHVLIIDGDGNIVESRSGYTEGSEQHIIDKIRELVNK